jgi:DNA-binding CsgD family transcriptional regulator
MDSRKAELIGKIYDSTFCTESLGYAMNLLRELLDASAGVLFSYSSDGGPSLWDLQGFDEEVFSAYEAYYHHFDDYKHALVATDNLRTGYVFTEWSLLQPPKIQQSPLIQELLLPNELGPILGVPAYVASNGDVVELALYRPPGVEPFSRTEVEFLTEIVVHIGRAAKIRLRFTEDRTVPSWTHEVLNGLSWGIVLLDNAGHVLFANDEACRIARADDGLKISCKGVSATQFVDAACLARLVDLARRGCATGGDMKVQRPSGKQAYVLTVAPLAGTTWTKIGGCLPKVIVHILDLERRPPDHASRLAKLFALTPAEQAVALCLMQEFSLSEIAARNGVAISTIKSQIASVFAKTGTDKQSHLVALLHRIFSIPGTK